MSQVNLTVTVGRKIELIWNFIGEADLLDDDNLTKRQKVGEYDASGVLSCDNYITSLCLINS